MPDKKQDLIDQRLQDLNNDGVDRRGFLKCMAWAGTGLVWTMSGGIPVSRAFAKTADRSAGKGGDFSFVQISDSHIGFNKPANLEAGGMGSLGHEQLEWLEDDLKGRTASTPIVLFAHIPLWTIYPEWGWGTDDSEQALSYVKRFGSVTVLNGHIHQIMQKVEGKVSFHTAMSTAFPQPAPGTAPSAGPMKVPADQLQRVLGITDVNYVVSGRSLAVVDSPLGA